MEMNIYLLVPLLVYLQLVDTSPPKNLFQIASTILPKAIGIFQI